MGLYLNPGNETFAGIIANDVYVDKTGLIAYMNGRIGKAKHGLPSKAAFKETGAAHRMKVG